MNNYFIFDFDSTIVKDETLEELAQLALHDNPAKEQIMQTMRSITAQGMSGEIPFSQSLSSRIQLFSATKQHLDQYAQTLKTRVTDSVLRNKQFFQNNADYIYIISGGFQDYILPIAQDLGIHSTHVLANSFIFDDKDNIVGIDTNNPLAHSGGKATQVKLLNLPGPIIVVGDGYTDFEIKNQKAADTFIAFTENVTRENVVALSDLVAQTFDDIVNIKSSPTPAAKQV
jgi:D-3-phosphoglycerate dehydrogenase / 2-oxoglutarate reductase